jgi:hypothetical protein
MDRQDPFKGATYEQSEVVPEVGALMKNPRQVRQTRVRPSERRRRLRMLTVTFSDEAFVDRIRELAERWGLVTTNGSFNSSAVVEYLIAGPLERAESGELPPPQSPPLGGR